MQAPINKVICVNVDEKLWEDMTVPGRMLLLMNLMTGFMMNPLAFEAEGYQVRLVQDGIPILNDAVIMQLGDKPVFPSLQVGNA